MRKFLLILGFALLLALSPALAQAQTAADKEFAGDMSFARNNINAYWASQFKSWKLVYRPPANVVGYSTAFRSKACGYIPTNNAGYCGSNNIIYYDVNFLKRYYRTVGDFAPVLVLAHEWGHLVQLNLLRDGYDPTYSGYRVIEYNLYLELQADCFAGAWTQHSKQIGWLEAGDLDEATISLYGAGDEEAMPWFDPAAHGQPGQRVDAFIAGYDGGPLACLKLAACSRSSPCSTSIPWSSLR